MKGIVLIAGLVWVMGVTYATAECADRFSAARDAYREAIELEREARALIAARDELPIEDRRHPASPQACKLTRTAARGFDQAERALRHAVTMMVEAQEICSGKLSADARQSATFVRRSRRGASLARVRANAWVGQRCLD